MSAADIELRDRFVDSLLVMPSGCWDWRGQRDVQGYGYIERKGRHRAHRFAYEWMIGPIPAGLQIDHLCRNRACVNPSHMEAVTARENTLRGVGAPAQNARKTHCKYGHAFTDENTRWRPLGGRECRTCKRERDRRIRAERKRQK